MAVKVLLVSFLLQVGSAAVAQQVLRVSGRVTGVAGAGEAGGRPLPFARVTVNENYAALTDDSGRYELVLRRFDEPVLRIRVSYVGKKEAVRTVEVNGGTELEVDVALAEDDLFLDEITVSARRDEENVSASAYVIDRSAIEQTQAFSLADLLQLLPGQTITDPQLHGGQTVNFRSDLSGQYSMNNAFGIGLFVNGASLNNNANMQSANPLLDGFKSFGGSRQGGEEYASNETPGSGFDLRRVPVGNIERVEVVQGVPSAEYGDITEGAVIIETFAGPSPWLVNVRQAGGNTGISGSKGLRLNDNHALNVSLDYLYSNANPVDKVKSYNRVNGQVIWTARVGERLENTLNVSYGRTLDDFRVDPDFGDDVRVYARNTSLNVTNRTRYTGPAAWFDSFDLSLHVSAGHQVSHLDQYVNPGVGPVTTNMNPGVSEGTFHPGNYRASRTIDGRPVQLSGNLRFRKTFGRHRLRYGGSVRYTVNMGRGRVFDPLRPVRTSGLSESDRPLSYREMRPAQTLVGFYAEDRFDFALLGKPLRASAGLRADLQHGYTGLSPRINARYGLSENWSLNGGFGYALKAPGLVHLFPGPAYTDYTLLNSYNGRVNESLYLAYTHVSEPENRHLKPMQSVRYEAGVRYRRERLHASLTFFSNTGRRGFTAGESTEVSEVALPEYEIIDRPAGKTPVYRATGNTRAVLLPERTVSNGLFTRNHGVELVAGTGKIPALHTSFNLNLGYFNSYYFYNRQRVNTRREVQPSDEIKYGIYPEDRRRNGTSRALLTVNNHLSKLGLSAVLRIESFLYNYTRTLANSNRAIAYINNRGEVVPIPETEIDDPRYDVLDTDPTASGYLRQPDFVYFNMHLNLSKNLGKHTRFSFFANNFLNIRPEYEKPNGGGTVLYNADPYFGLEVFFKF